MASHIEKSVDVKLDGKKFSVSSGDVVKRLASATVIAEEPGTPGGATSDGFGTIRLQDGILGRGNLTGPRLASFQEYGIVHEGIHFTGFGPMPNGERSKTGERSVFDPSRLSVEPLRSKHQQPYNDAARELLR